MQVDKPVAVATQVQMSVFDTQLARCWVFALIGDPDIDQLSIAPPGVLAVAMVENFRPGTPVEKIVPDIWWTVVAVAQMIGLEIEQGVVSVAQMMGPGTDLVAGGSVAPLFDPGVALAARVVVVWLVDPDIAMVAGPDFRSGGPGIVVGWVLPPVDPDIGELVDHLVPPLRPEIARNYASPAVP